MRLDKYLKVSRLIKRRTLAKEVCDKGRIEINGRVAKASAEVKEEDLITIRFVKKTLTAKVLKIKDSSKKTDAVDMYEVVEEKMLETTEDDFWNHK